MEEPITIRNEAEVEAAAAKRRGTSEWRSRAEEYEMISDLTGFDNLRAMMEGEATLKRRKRRRKRRRKKNNSESQFHAQQPVPVEAERPAIDKEQAGRDEAVRTLEVSKMNLIQISDNNVSQNLAVDAVRIEGKGDESREVIDLCSSSSEDDQSGEMVSVKATINEDNETVRRKKLKTVVTEETVDAGKKEMHAECVETVKSPETQNTVLRKLLKPRYFDPPTGGWACVSCGGDHPAAANCTLQKRVKPCFICGSLQHIGKHCVQGQFCFVCRGRGNQPNDCIGKQEENNLTYIICLRCGDSGHDMFSCRSDYSPDDLKKIRCYVCNGFGHLSCVNLPDTSPAEVSCYNCSRSGHLGSECTKFPKVARCSNAPALCYRCGDEGHFARTCSLSRKRARRVQAEMRRSLGSTSAPPNLREPQNGAKGKIQERLIINIDE